MQSTYLLLPVGILSFLLYALSWLLVITGFQSRRLHNRIWNVILLFVFLVTGVLGLLLTIQINYKLEWPFVRPMLEWHVNFGIALSLVAFFHLFERLWFYTGLFKRGKNSSKQFETETPKISGPIKRFPLLMLLSGFLSTVVQVLYIREITTLFQGNELMMGWTLGGWMLLTGLGAFTGSRRTKKATLQHTLYRVIFLLGLLPFLMLLLAGIVKPLILPPGMLTGPAVFILLVLLILAPVGLLCGYAYAMLVKINQLTEKDYVKVYVLESAGSLVGGMLVSFVLIQWFTVLQSLLLLALFVFIVLYVHEKRVRTGVALLLSLTLFVIFCFSNIELKIRSLQYANQEVVESRETLYGNVTVTKNGGQYNFFESGRLLFTTNDVVGNEEAVHFAMLQTESPESVLLISGNARGMTREILKYPSVKRVDNVEQNKALIEMVNQYTTVSTDKRISRSFTDGLRFLKKTGSRYDVAIVAVPGPSSLQYNRFYTASFFELLKMRMNENGVVAVGMPPSGNYLMPETVNAAGPVFQAMKKHFANVIIVPGEKDYLLASDGPLSPAIAELATEKNIEATYVNPFYIDDFSLKHRGKQLTEKLNTVSRLNTDERPLPVFYHTLRYIGQFSNRQLLVLMVPVLVLLIPLFFMSPVSGGMYITGFTASSAEVLLLFLFQVVFGYLYSAIGLIIALFMGGLALGGIAGYSFKTGRLHFLIVQTLLGVFAALIPLFWMLLKTMHSGVWGWMVFIVITLIPATLTGFQYVASTQQYQSSRIKGASVIYAADLLGGAMGTVLITLVLVPFLGIKNSCFVLAAANGVVVFVHVLRNRKRVFD
ncbi:MAG: hypothetical protein K9H26_00230 [Prolixibacteraceae bacterium]|nr:hypothetical protein [Prolixibacteraceae bacterium]